MPSFRHTKLLSARSTLRTWSVMFALVVLLYYLPRQSNDSLELQAQA
jgi:hypothetical protein